MLVSANAERLCKSQFAVQAFSRDQNRVKNWRLCIITYSTGVNPVHTIQQCQQCGSTVLHWFERTLAFPEVVKGAKEL